jgi:hypothetical protein
MIRHKFARGKVGAWFYSWSMTVLALMRVLI